MNRAPLKYKANLRQNGICLKKIRKQLEFLAKICEDEENGQDLPITQGKRPK